MATADIIVIGGGIIGCAAARELARRGAHVTLVERTAIGAEASSAAAGTLGAQAECEAPGPLLDLALESRLLFPEWLATLREETGIECDRSAHGILYCALSDEDDETLRRRVAWQEEAGLTVECLSRAQALQREPRLSPELRWAVHYPDDRWLDPRRLMTALALSLERAGVDVRTAQTAVRITASGGAVTGVECDSARYDADAVVNAAGSWAGLITLPDGVRPLPLVPMRGQMLAIRVAAGSPRCALHSACGYLVPRQQGTQSAGGSRYVVAGSTYEDVGYDTRVTVGGVHRIMAAAVALMPSVRDGEVAETWAGLRPLTIDGLPVVGEAGEIAQLWYATGHGRNGILLAPVTGRVVADLVLGGRSGVDVSAFSPDRFWSSGSVA